jgi:hypothetical protein
LKAPDYPENDNSLSRRGADVFKEEEGRKEGRKEDYTSDSSIYISSYPPDLHAHYM